MGTGLACFVRVLRRITDPLFRRAGIGLGDEDDPHRHLWAPGMTGAKLFLIEAAVLILLIVVGCVFAPYLARVLASLDRQSIQRIGLGIIVGSLGTALVLWLTGS